MCRAGAGSGVEIARQGEREQERECGQERGRASGQLLISLSGQGGPG